MDPNLQSLLKWSVENTPTTTTTNPSADSSTPSSRPINPDALNALFGGPSDAELMNLSMSAILSTDPQITLEDKLTAFDNFEQLIENLDNANNLEPLSLWTPLLSCLTSPEPEIRKMAAWCVGTAVQNNLKSQEKLVAAGEAGIPELVKVARREGEEEGVRRKACYALSSACRNFQPAMDLLTGSMGKEKVDAGDMDEVDVLIGGLRDGVKATVTA
ncbi:nucleotide exchange factor Fes1 [Cadophora sp. MPI-SDFR-AT-0126]|nr:nucleotide exchange factor Fes1 [Leotiomycetes sp. MPI-SDFR-AT-0126]